MKLRVLSLPLMLMMLAYSCNAQSQHEADLSWGASTTTGAQYKVRRGTAPGGTKTVIQTVAGLTFVDSGLAANKQFCYDVVATDPSGVLADANPTAEVCGVTGKDQTIPAGNLTVIFK